MEEVIKQRKKYVLIHTTSTIILTIVLITLGFMVGYRISINGGGMTGILATVLGHDENTVENLESMTILIVGESGGMTDTIMVCSYVPKTQEASIISIPRDTFIGKNQSNVTASDKINSIYSAKGIEQLVYEVEKITNLEIPYYIKVDTESLKKLVDTIGGIDFYVPINMNYDDNKQNLHIHLQQGFQHLNGKQAEEVVRFRHNNNGTTYSSEYGDNDYGRMRTQRDFLKEVLKKTIKIGNVLKISEFIDIGSKYVETNINIREIKDYIPYIIEFNINNLKTDVLPGNSEKINGVWMFIINEEEKQEIIEKMF